MNDTSGLRSKKVGDTVWVCSCELQKSFTGAREALVTKVGREYLYTQHDRFRLDNGMQGRCDGFSPAARAYSDEASYLYAKDRSERETKAIRLMDYGRARRLSDGILNAIIEELEQPE